MLGCTHWHATHQIDDQDMKALMIDLVIVITTSSRNCVQLGQRGEGDAHFIGSPSSHSWGY
jgi:hypothetical protein